MSEERTERFYPLSAREALLAVRFDIAGLHVDSDLDAAIEKIDRQAADGLGLLGARPDFELTDQLADRLAEAHEVLRKLVDMAPEGPEERDLVGSAAEALALPPDLEAMIERRIDR
jgi:hypothetical protein